MASQIQSMKNTSSSRMTSSSTTCQNLRQILFSGNSQIIGIGAREDMGFLKTVESTDIETNARELESFSMPK
jgi:hypothetical protein